MNQKTHQELLKQTIRNLDSACAWINVAIFFACVTCAMKIAMVVAMVIKG